MEQITNNQQKYQNYCEQMKRLKKAISEQFYLEAIFIEYAIMEDRLESALRHSGKFNTEKPMSIEKKCANILKLCEEKKSPAKRYFSEELIQSIKAWKANRNDLIHSLLKQSLHTENLKEIAEKGLLIVKSLNVKVSGYNRAIEKVK